MYNLTHTWGRLPSDFGTVGEELELGRGRVLGRSWSWVGAGCWGGVGVGSGQGSEEGTTSEQWTILRVLIANIKCIHPFHFSCC